MRAMFAANYEERLGFRDFTVTCSSCRVHRMIFSDESTVLNAQKIQ
jgi:hypothetical protein